MRWCATAATNALDHEADIAKVQEWLGHANIAIDTHGISVPVRVPSAQVLRNGSREAAMSATRPTMIATVTVIFAVAFNQLIGPSVDAGISVAIHTAWSGAASWLFPYRDRDAVFADGSALSCRVTSNPDGSKTYKAIVTKPTTLPDGNINVQILTRTVTPRADPYGVRDSFDTLAKEITISHGNIVSLQWADTALAALPDPHDAFKDGYFQGGYLVKDGVAGDYPYPRPTPSAYPDGPQKFLYSIAVADVAVPNSRQTLAQRIALCNGLDMKIRNLGGELKR